MDFPEWFYSPPLFAAVLAVTLALMFALGRASKGD